MAAKQIESEYITLADAARIVGVSSRTMRRWVMEEKIEPEVLFGRYILSREYFERWKKRNITKKVHE